HETVTNPASKTPPVCHEVHGFQQAGLATAVVPHHQIEPGRWPQVDVGQPPQPLYLQALDHHGSTKRQRPEKPGRCLCSTWNMRLAPIPSEAQGHYHVARMLVVGAANQCG